MSYVRDRKAFRKKVRKATLNFKANLKKKPKQTEKYGWNSVMKSYFSKKRNEKFG